MFSFFAQIFHLPMWCPSHFAVVLRIPFQHLQQKYIFIHPDCELTATNVENSPNDSGKHDFCLPFSERSTSPGLALRPRIHFRLRYSEPAAKETLEMSLLWNNDKTIRRCMTRIHHNDNSDLVKEFAFATNERILPSHLRCGGFAFLPVGTFDWLKMRLL